MTTLICFRQNRLPKKLTDNKGISLFSVDKFLSHSTKHFRGEKLRCFRKFLVPQSLFDKRRGCITSFFQIFCLTLSKIFVGEPFCGPEENLVSKKFKKGISIFCANIFLSHRVQKIRRGTLLCFGKNRVSKNLMHKNGISLISLGKFLSHSAEKSRKGPLPCFR